MGGNIRRRPAKRNRHAAGQLRSARAAEMASCRAAELAPLARRQPLGHRQLASRQRQPPGQRAALLAVDGHAGEGRRTLPEHLAPPRGLVDDGHLARRHMHPLQLPRGAEARQEGHHDRQHVDAEEERHVEGAHVDEHRRRAAVGERHHRDQDDETALGERAMRPDFGVHVDGAFHDGRKIDPPAGLAKRPRAAIVRPMAGAAKKPKRQAGAKKRLKPAEQARIAEIFERFEAEEADPRTELDYKSPFTLVVAVALSAQATDISVNKATAELFVVADTPAKMLALGEAGLKPFIASIGLYNTKAKNVIATAKILVEQYGG